MTKNVINKTFVANTESINSYGFRVLTAGIRLGRFEKNPIAMGGHYGTVGKWLGWKKEENNLVVEGLQFSRNERAQALKMDVEDGIISAVSMGIRIIATSNAPDLMLPGQKYDTVTECELYEVSLVDVPSNPEALEVRLYAENEKGEMVQLSAESALKTVSTPIPTMEIEKKVQELASKLEAESSARLALEQKVQALEQENQDLKSKADAMLSAQAVLERFEKGFTASLAQNDEKKELLAKLAAHPNWDEARWWNDDNAAYNRMLALIPEEFANQTKKK